MRDEIIEILEMISPGISVENNYLNLVEYLESMEMIEFIEELENNFDIEIPSEEKIEENFEIEKILQDLSKLFYPYIEELKLDIECIGKLDFIFAKAKYSKFINAITPIINEEKNEPNIKYSFICNDSVFRVFI